MKKVIRTIAAATLLFACTMVMAKEPKLETDGVSKSIVFEWDAQLSKASLEIFDAKGIVMYTDYLNDVNAYGKKFDLSSLIEGIYFLKIENELKELVYSIRVNKSNVSILDKEVNFKPTYKNKEGRVYLTLPNFNGEEVEISVIDSFGNVLFKETMKDSLIVEKVINFKKALSGEYTIIIERDKNTSYKTITVK